MITVGPTRLFRDTVRTGRTALALITVIASGCTTREDRIAVLSRSFKAKNLKPDVYRDEEVIELGKLGAFRKGMTRAEIEGILGKPSFPWYDVPKAVTEKEGFDERCVYALSTVSDLYVEYLRGGLYYMYICNEVPDEYGGGIIPIKLAERKR